MSEAKPTPARPDGVNVSTTEAGMIVLEFDHPDVPPIVLSKPGAERVASYVHSVIGRMNQPDDVDDV